MKTNLGCLLAALALNLSLHSTAPAIEPAVLNEPTVFQEREGVVAVEAEHFTRQTKMDTRAWHLTTADRTPEVSPDGDPSHVAGASNGAYLEILPDTRRTHADKLTRGVNFAPEAGAMAVLEYQVDFKTPGRYYVWVRAYSTGSEDNGLHVGLDGKWPESGQRLQWCEGKQSWRWESKQRTEEQHCGEPHKIYLDIETAGQHTIAFSMREDGFEFDKWLMTTDRDYKRPEGVGPKPQVHSGDVPEAYPLVAPAANSTSDQTAAKKTPQSTSVTVQSQEAAGGNTAGRNNTGLVMLATAFPTDGTGYYLHQGKWMAVNPDKNKSGKTSATFNGPTGLYNVVIRAVGENDGSSTYEVAVDSESIGTFTCPLADAVYEEGPKYQATFKNVKITDGAIITVASQIASADGQEYSRARWSAVVFRPADAATRAAAKPFLEKQRTAAPVQGVVPVSPTVPVSSQPLQQPRQPDGDASVKLSGEKMLWHRVSLLLDGPFAHEQDNAPNPFTDLAFSVLFQHSSGAERLVQGHFAADGDAANSSSESGTTWRAHFAPDLEGEWSYKVNFRTGEMSALYPDRASKPLAPFDGLTGSFEVEASDKSGRDLRAHGRLQYVGERYLKFAGSGQHFLKVGADAPETLLGYADFDATVANKPDKVPLKSYAPHVGDWSDGDPTWKDGKGKGLIGAINYLSGKGCNAFSFLTYNAGGDGDNVWPFIQRNDKMHYDCSKLDQWSIVFEHGTAKGMYLHFKMQETENDDHRRGTNKKEQGVPESLDGGDLGPQRRLYVRELVSRFGHNLALNWNLGEENTQTTSQIKAMLDYIDLMDPYDNNRVLHTFPGEQDLQYRPLLGESSSLTGLSLQNSGIQDTHVQTVKWVELSSQSGKPWVVAFDESGTAAHGQCPDLGYEGFDGHDRTGKMTYTEHDVRHQTLWGTLMAGGAGVEYYFGYQYAQNDLVCEDWRSRDRSWDYCRIAIEFFHANDIPFWEMECHDELVGNPDHNNSAYCLAKPGSLYVLYLPKIERGRLDLSAAEGVFSVHWYDPIKGGDLQIGSLDSTTGGKSQTLLGYPPANPDQDWVVLLRAK